jgi:hypothetical protein
MFLTLFTITDKLFGSSGKFFKTAGIVSGYTDKVSESMYNAFIHSGRAS